MAKQLNHSELCTLATKWLKRPYSRNGVACSLSFSEVRGHWKGETPDAIGWRNSEHHGGSFLVEAKMSRADFLSDKSKEHRVDGVGMGNYRYFICPEGLIGIDELPEKWGLIYVNHRHLITPVAGPYPGLSSALFEKAMEDYLWHANMERERELLVTMLGRVGDVEKMNKTLKDAWNFGNRAARTQMRLNDENKSLRARLMALEVKIQQAGFELV